MLVIYPAKKKVYMYFYFYMFVLGSECQILEQIFFLKPEGKIPSVQSKDIVSHTKASFVCNVCMDSWVPVIKDLLTALSTAITNLHFQDVKADLVIFMSKSL